jgi:hypothetical protein
VPEGLIQEDLVMKSPDAKNQPAKRLPADISRRDFLRKSVYAAYATPVITVLLVEQANAAASTGNPHCDDPLWKIAHPGVCN